MKPALYALAHRVSAAHAPVIHIHDPDPYPSAFAFICGTYDAKGRVAKPGESVTCERCKHLMWRIRGDYTYGGKRRMATIAGDTHS